MFEFIQKIIKWFSNLFKRKVLVDNQSKCNYGYNRTWLDEFKCGKNEEGDYLLAQEEFRIYLPSLAKSNWVQYKEKEISDFDIDLSADCDGIVNGRETNELEHRMPLLNYFKSTEDISNNPPILREPSVSDCHFKLSEMSLDDRQKEYFAWSIPNR